MRQPLRKIEAIDGGPAEVGVAGHRANDHASNEIGMIFAAGRVVFLPEGKTETRVVRNVARPGC